MTHSITHTGDGIMLYFGTEYEDIDFEKATDFLRTALGHLSLDGFRSHLKKEYVKGDGWVYRNKGIFDVAYESMVQFGWTTAIPITVPVKGGKYWEKHISGLQRRKGLYENQETPSKRDPGRIKYLDEQIKICKHKSSSQDKIIASLSYVRKFCASKEPASYKSSDAPEKIRKTQFK
jgi:hypothetical protein